MENELGLEQVFFFVGLIGLEQVNSSVPSSTTTKKNYINFTCSIKNTCSCIDNNEHINEII
jgi:hypothetical protein